MRKTLTMMMRLLQDCIDERVCNLSSKVVLVEGCNFVLKNGISGEFALCFMSNGGTSKRTYVISLPGNVEARQLVPLIFSICFMFREK